MSKSGSVISANLGLNFDDFEKVARGGSQRSSLFPWDNAGPSSGSGDVAGPDIDQPTEPVSVRLRSDSVNSRRESPFAPSQRGSAVGGLTFSPVIGKGGSQIMGEDFAFDGWSSFEIMMLNEFCLVDNPVAEDTQQETQKSDMNLVTLERNSYNFLE
jgi:meiotic recombination protein REC8